MKAGERNSLTDVPGVLVGHHHLLDVDAAMGRGAATGTTVVRFPGGATASVDVRGGGPGTRETDLLDPANSVQRIHAVVLTGGSAYGLAAADGVMDWLSLRGVGIAIPAAVPGRPGGVVPIVPAAVIFDLMVGDWDTRPNADFGHTAAGAAAADFARGSVGAGTGAIAGVVKGGVGSASVTTDDGTTVGALVVANPFGSVFDPRTGLLRGDPGPAHHLCRPPRDQVVALNELVSRASAFNTSIGVVATDAPLDKSDCRRMAIAAHDGLARAVNPAHTPLDGDTLFAVSTAGAPGLTESSPSVYEQWCVARDTPRTGLEGLRSDVSRLAAICAGAAVAVERAVVDAILSALPVAGIPCYRDVAPDAVR